MVECAPSLFFHIQPQKTTKNARNTSKTHTLIMDCRVVFGLLYAQLRLMLEHQVKRISPD